MNTFDYLTISAESFLRLAVYDPGSGFVSDDEEGRAWKRIRRDGFRFVTIHDGRAIFEKTYGQKEEA